MPGLFDPIAIRGLTLRNRVVMPPMVPTHRARTAEAGVTDSQIDYYSRRARGGAALIIVELVYPMPSGRAYTAQLGIDDDRKIAGFRRLVQAVHEAGAAIGIQIGHAGGRASAAVIGQQPVGPSAVATVPGAFDTRKADDMELPRALDIADMQEIVAAFGQAARRAIEAGFDVVEVHGAHGYLLSQFASPYTNKRTDEYGGDLARRFRFPIEVIREVRSRLGSERPLFYRIGADDFRPGGHTLEDSCRIAPDLLKAGVDVLDISGGLGGSGRNRFKEQGFFVPAAQAIKEASGAIVVGVGNIRDPRYADGVVREGRIDLVAVGRGMLKDPDWAAKAREALSQPVR